MSTHTITASITTGLADNPGNAALAGYSATLLLGEAPHGDPAQAADESGPFAFSVDVPGAFKVSVQRIDTSGQPFGTPAVSDVFVIEPDQVAVPLTVTVAVQ